MRAQRVGLLILSCCGGLGALIDNKRWPVRPEVSLLWSPLHFIRTTTALLHTMSSLLKKLEVKPTDDEYEKIETSRWGNRDVYPIAHDKRTYGIYAYVSYWGKLSVVGLI